MYGEPLAAVLALAPMPAPAPVVAPVPAAAPKEPPPNVPEKLGVVYGDANMVTVGTRLFGTV